jgi:hypothetical protein
MGHVNDDYGFVQLYPVGINGISDQSGNKKQEIVEVNARSAETLRVVLPGGGVSE